MMHGSHDIRASLSHKKKEWLQGCFKHFTIPSLFTTEKTPLFYRMT